MGPALIVVDANILVYSLVNNEKSRAAQRLKEKDPVWKFPVLWRYEFGNALALMVRKKELDEKTASRVLATAHEAFSVGETDAELDAAFHVAAGRGITFYDAQYLALAQALGVPLVTEDKGLQRAGAGVAVSMEEFLN